jgi:hypothetical protein
VLAAPPPDQIQEGKRQGKCIEKRKERERIQTFRKEAETVCEVECEKEHNCADDNEFEQMPAELSIPFAHIII